jgi:hypothetical protein
MKIKNLQRHLCKYRSKQHDAYSLSQSRETVLLKQLSYEN